MYQEDVVELKIIDMLYCSCLWVCYFPLRWVPILLLQSGTRFQGRSLQAPYIRAS